MAYQTHQWCNHFGLSLFFPSSIVNLILLIKWSHRLDSRLSKRRWSAWYHVDCKGRSATLDDLPELDRAFSYAKLRIWLWLVHLFFNTLLPKGHSTDPCQQNKSPDSWSYLGKEGLPEVVSVNHLLITWSTAEVPSSSSAVQIQVALCVAAGTSRLGSVTGPNSCIH